MALAEQMLADEQLASMLTVTHRPEVGAVVMQVREPVAAERFHLGDVVVTRAEVGLDGERGWAMRMGGDRASALGAALCDAVASTTRPEWQPWRAEIDALCRQTAEHHAERDRRENDELAPTAVSFEELD